MIEPFNSALANFSRMRVDGCSRNDFSSRIGEARIYVYKLCPMGLEKFQRYEFDGSLRRKYNVVTF